jgi:N-acetylglucosamine transport system permease protein
MALLFVVYPFLVLLYGSLKSDSDFLTNPLSFPVVPHFENYAYAWNAAHIPNYTINSAIVAGATVVLTLVLAATASYGLSQFRFRGAKLIYLSFVVYLVLQRQFMAGLTAGAIQG